MKKNEMIPLKNEEKKIHREQNCVIYAKKDLVLFSTDDDDNKKYNKVRGHCHFTGKYTGVAHDICNSCSIS